MNEVALKPERGLRVETGARSSVRVSPSLIMAHVYMYLVHIFSKIQDSDIKSDPSLINNYMPWRLKTELKKQGYANIDSVFYAEWREEDGLYVIGKTN